MTNSANYSKHLYEMFLDGGNACLILSRFILLRKIFMNKSVSGLSLKTNIIYLILYLFRYYYLFNLNLSYYELVIRNGLKFFIVVLQFFIVFLMVSKFRRSYNKKQDNFPMAVIFVTSIIIGFIITERRTWYYSAQLYYNISLILESVAILPQLVMLQEAGDCELMNSKYILFLGLYRLFYLASFITIYFTYTYVDVSTFLITSLIQNVLYLDFFFIYFNYLFPSNSDDEEVSGYGSKEEGIPRIKYDARNYQYIKQCSI